MGDGLWHCFTHSIYNRFGSSQQKLGCPQAPKTPAALPILSVSAAPPSTRTDQLQIDCAWRYPTNVKDREICKNGSQLVIQRIKKWGEKHPSLSEIYEVVLISRCQGFDSQTVSQSWKADSSANATTNATNATNDPGFQRVCGKQSFFGPHLEPWPTFCVDDQFHLQYFLQLLQAIGSDSLTCLMNIWFDSLGFAAREPENRTKWRGGLMPAWWFQTCSNHTWHVFFCISLSHLPVNVVNPINHP